MQIAVIGVDGSTLLDTLVKPGAPIPWDATRIHGITDDLVAGAPTFGQVHQQLMELLRGKRVVIYNADYDTRMIYQSGKLYAYLPVILADSWECAMEKYAAYIDEWNEYHGNYRWQRLPGGDHSARGDALATLAIVKRMAAAKLSTETREEDKTHGQP